MGRVTRAQGLNTTMTSDYGLSRCHPAGPSGLNLLRHSWKTWEVINYKACLAALSTP